MLARNPRDLGLLVRDRRHELELSQQELADRAGVSRSWLVAVEKGHPRAELGKLFALLAELGLTLKVTEVRAVGEGVTDLDELLGGYEVQTGAPI